MAASIFDSLCEELERATGLDRLVLRGTVRLALKSVGLDAAALTKRHVELVAEKILPAELEKRGVADAARLCASVLGRIAVSEGEGRDDSESPDAIFRRLAAR